MKIAICEDLKDDRIQIVSAIDSYCKTTQSICHIFEFDCGEAILKNFKKGMYDIIFLDIYMKNMTGIDTAENIRKIDIDCCIVFITSSLDFSLKAFELEALDYFVKPLIPSKIIKFLNRYKKLYKDASQYIQIKEDGISKNIILKNILYIEVCGNYCFIHTIKKIFKTRASLRKFTIELQKFINFTQCHQSYIINLDKILRFDKSTIFLSTNESVPISRKYSSSFKQSFSEYCAVKTRNII